MPITNLIVNGDFNLGNTGWSGTDMETSYNEHTYLGNGNTVVYEQIPVANQHFPLIDPGGSAHFILVSNALRRGQDGISANSPKKR